MTTKRRKYSTQKEKVDIMPPKQNNFRSICFFGACIHMKPVHNKLNVFRSSILCRFDFKNFNVFYEKPFFPLLFT